MNEDKLKEILDRLDDHARQLSYLTDALKSLKQIVEMAIVTFAIIAVVQSL